MKNQNNTMPCPKIRPTEPQGVAGGPDLQEIMECPVCYEICVPPIYICVSGHSLCQFCKKKVGKSCPCCRKSVGTGRNYALESIYNGTRFSCTFKDSGCPEFPKGDQFESHVTLCPFRSFTCTFSNSPECKCYSKPGGFTLEFNMVLPHLVKGHSTDLKSSGQYSFHLETIPLATSSEFKMDIPLTCWEYDARYFLELISVRGDIIYLSILIIGEVPEVVDYVIDYSLIREGVECCPNILKTVSRIKGQSIREPLDTSLSISYFLPYFKDEICRLDASTQGMRWMSRVDIKKVTLA